MQNSKNSKSLIACIVMVSGVFDFSFRSGFPKLIFKIAPFSEI